MPHRCGDSVESVSPRGNSLFGLCIHPVYPQVRRDTMSTKTTNEFGGEFGGITLLGKAHSLSALFIVLLRATIGGMILFAGLGKVSEWPFDAAGYLANADPASPVSGLYAAMASNAALMEFVNVFVPATQLLIGAALLAGAFVR